MQSVLCENMGDFLDLHGLWHALYSAGRSFVCFGRTKKLCWEGRCMEVVGMTKCVVCLNVCFFIAQRLSPAQGQLCGFEPAVGRESCTEVAPVALLSETSFFWGGPHGACTPLGRRLRTLFFLWMIWSVCSFVEVPVRSVMLDKGSMSGSTVHWLWMPWAGMTMDWETISSCALKMETVGPVFLEGSEPDNMC